jgi:hypothetical protein
VQMYGSRIAASATVQPVYDQEVLALDVYLAQSAASPNEVLIVRHCTRSAKLLTPQSSAEP